MVETRDAQEEEIASSRQNILNEVTHILFFLVIQVRNLDEPGQLGCKVCNPNLRNCARCQGLWGR